MNTGRIPAGSIPADQEGSADELLSYNLMLRNIFRVDIHT
jgi:hypothetical protein